MLLLFNRYVNSDKYVLKQSESFKNKIFYLKNNSKSSFIDNFKEKMIVPQIGKQIHIKDMFFLWKRYLKRERLPNMIYKAEFENIIRATMENNNNFFINIKSNYLNNTKIVQKFWQESIRKNIDEELELSEFNALILKWCESKEFSLIDFDEIKLKEIIRHFYDDITIENEKFLIGISCNFWDKQGDILEALK